MTRVCLYILRVDVIFSGRGSSTCTKILVIRLPSPRKAKPFSRGRDGKFHWQSPLKSTNP